MGGLRELCTGTVLSLAEPDGDSGLEIVVHCPIGDRSARPAR
jgi:hypothetical protein